MRPEATESIDCLRNQIREKATKALQSAIAERGSGVIPGSIAQLTCMIIKAGVAGKNDELTIYQFALLGLLEVVDEVEAVAASN